MPAGFTESEVERATLDWLESIGWRIKNGREVAPGKLYPTRESYRRAVPARKLQDALLSKLPTGEVRTLKAFLSQESPLPAAGKGRCDHPECEEADVKKGDESA